MAASDMVAWKGVTFDNPFEHLSITRINQNNLLVRYEPGIGPAPLEIGIGKAEKLAKALLETIAECRKEAA